jgi:hypothetical protein
MDLSLKMVRGNNYIENLSLKESKILGLALFLFSGLLVFLATADAGLLTGLLLFFVIDLCEHLHPLHLQSLQLHLEQSLRLEQGMQRHSQGISLTISLFFVYLFSIQFLKLFIIFSLIKII